MKRTLVLFGLLACFAIGVSAQSIIGTWRSQPLQEEENMEARVEFTFNKNKTLLLNMNITVSDPTSMEMVCHFAINGTYDNMVGDLLPIKLSKDNVVLAIDKLDLKGEMAEMSNPEMIESIKKILEQQLEQGKEEMIEDFPEEGELIISDITSTSMTINMPGQEKLLKMTKVK